MRVWDADSGKLLHSLEIDQPGQSVAFSPDGSVLIAGTIGTRSDASEPIRSHLFAWSLTKKQAQLRWKTPMIGDTRGVAVEPNGEWCIVITLYAQLGFYDLKTGKLKRLWTEAGNAPNDLAVTPDGNTVVTAGQHFILWDMTAEKLPTRDLDPESALRYRSDASNI